MSLAFKELDDGLFEEVHRLELRNLPTPWSKELLRVELQKEVTRALGLFFEGQLIGHSICHQIIDELHILTLCVDAPYRRRGYGRILLEEVLRRGAFHGATKAWLEVREGNYAARRLYLAVGFEEHSIRRGYYSDNQEDAVILEHSLNRPNLLQ